MISDRERREKSDAPTVRARLTHLVGVVDQALVEEPG
jgi:hypothetical protein